MTTQYFHHVTHSPILSKKRRLQYTYSQWRRQLWGTGARAPSTSNNFIFSSLWSKSDSQLSKYCVVCEISWCRCQQLTALSISTALVTKLLVIKQLLHPAVKSTVSAPWHNFHLAPPRNKSWRRHCLQLRSSLMDMLDCYDYRQNSFAVKPIMLLYASQTLRLVA